MSEDYYNTLGVDKGASDDEIKKAFRKKAHEYHPDKETGDEAKFKEANQAYSVLRDKDKRAQYDQFGTTFDGAGGPGGGPGGFGGFNPNDFADNFRAAGGVGAFEFDLGDLFGGIFGGQSRQAGVRRGSDIQVQTEISFKESYTGLEKDIDLYKAEACEHCKGDGAEPGTEKVTCDACAGKGQVARSVAFGLQVATVCPTCQGQGKKIKTRCGKCGGAGVTKQSKKIKIKIPAGIADGQSIILRGEGEAVGGGQAGDLFLGVRVAGDSQYERQGNEVLSTANITFSQSSLGDKIEVETLDGPVSLKIPAGTASGKVFRLRDKGMPSLQGSSKGDQLVTVQVTTPKSLSRSQKKLLKELQEEGL